MTTNITCRACKICFFNNALYRHFRSKQCIQLFYLIKFSKIDKKIHAVISIKTILTTDFSSTIFFFKIDFNQDIDIDYDFKN